MPGIMIIDEEMSKIIRIKYMFHQSPANQLEVILFEAIRAQEAVMKSIKKTEANKVDCHTCTRYSNCCRNTDEIHACQERYYALYIPKEGNPFKECHCFGCPRHCEHYTRFHHQCESCKQMVCLNKFPNQQFVGKTSSKRVLDHLIWICEDCQGIKISIGGK